MSSALEHVFPTVISTRDDACIKKIGISEDLTVDADGDAGSTSSAAAAAASVGLVSMSVHLVWQGEDGQHIPNPQSTAEEVS